MRRFFFALPLFVLFGLAAHEVSGDWVTTRTAGSESEKSSSGIVIVTSAMPDTPAGATSVDQLERGDVLALATDELVYTITNGKTLLLVRFYGGGGSADNGGRVDLVERTAGGDVFLESAYVHGTNFVFDMDRTFTGDGDRRIVIQRVNSGAAAVHVYGRIRGYEY